VTKYRTAKAHGSYAGELVVPAEAEKALFFGPSMSIQTVNLTGTETKVVLWVGGEGLDKDHVNGWGEPIEFVWTQPNLISKTDATQQAKFVLLGSFDRIKQHYTPTTARIILTMLGDCIDGHIYKRSFSREEAEKF